jgi:hypothetical protein
LRIANRCEEFLEDPQQVNDDLLYPPQGNKGISLWSVSRYIRGLVSAKLDEEMKKEEEKLREEDCADGVARLMKLRENINRILDKEMHVRVDNKVTDDGIKFFYMDIPILSEKYDQILKGQEE